MTDRIQPRTLKGFRDLLPELMIARERVVAVAKRVSASYGFSTTASPATMGQRERTCRPTEWTIWSKL